MADAVMNYDSSKTQSVQPMFGAGTHIPVDWLQRHTGTQVSSSILIKSAEGIDESNSYVVLGGGTSAIAGTTFYQANAQLIIP